MNVPAQKNRILTILIVLLVFCLMGLGYWFFFVKGNGLNFLNTDWGEYQELLEYRKEKKILASSFSVDAYVWYVDTSVEEDGTEYLILESVIYNRKIENNLMTEIKVLATEENITNIQKDFNYEITFEKDDSDNIVLKVVRIDIDEEKYLSELLDIMLAVPSDEELEESTEDIPEELQGEGNIQMDILEILVREKLLTLDWVSEGRKEELRNFLEAFKVEYSNENISNSFLPCYLSKELNVQYTSSLPSVSSLGEPIMTGDVIEMIESRYEESSLPPMFNDHLRLLVDEMRYCKSRSYREYVKEFEDSVNYLFNFQAINEETVIWLGEIVGELNSMGYTDVTKVDIEKYLPRYMDLSNDILIQECVFNECSRDYLISRIPMYIKDGEKGRVYSTIDIDMSLTLLSYMRGYENE